MHASLLSMLLFPCLATAADTPATEWTLKTSPHFEIRHESAWAPGSVAIEMEKLYGKLRLGLSMFAPWMVKEKVKIYIYSGKDSYLKGEFKPPKWSKGLAYFSSRTVVVYYTGDMGKLRAVIAHELAHLCFESFFAQRLKYPPVWLNEGLAVMMEDLSYDGEGPWSLALKYSEGAVFPKLQDFFKLDPESISSDSGVSYWYLQAFSSVSYLFRPRKRLQFMNFCSALREGEPLEKALWEAYRLSGVAGLSDEWGEWLRRYRGAKDKGSSSDFAASNYDFRPVELQQVGFSSFGRSGN